MAQLAALSSSEGVALGYTYGTNGLAATWDHDKIMGCQCSTNLYFGPLGGDYSDALGHDCGLRLCPHGDDPLTPGSQQEVQAIVCTGTGGTFTLTFRGETTGAISYNAVRTVAAESGSSPGTGVGESLEAKLEALAQSNRYIPSVLILLTAVELHCALRMDQMSYRSLSGRH